MRSAVNGHCGKESRLFGAAATSGETLPPITNRGGKGTNHCTTQKRASWSEALESQTILSKNGKAQFVRIPLPDKTVKTQIAFIDWVSFSFKVSSFKYEGISDDHVVISLSKQLHQIFGFEVTSKCEGGLNFYKASYDVGKNGWGHVCIGGQRDTVLVQIKGQGLLAAKSGWEHRLHGFISRVDARITRIDLAHDAFDSNTSLEDYVELYEYGAFASRGRAPSIERLGDWHNQNDNGRSLYIGKRKSGKLLRIYEKGCQMGGAFCDKYRNWVRVELELLAKDRIIPHETLLKPAQYLAGAYPALSFLNKVQLIVETRKKQAQIVVKRAVEVVRHQFGKHIWALSELFGKEEFFQMVTKDKCELPAKLDLGDYSTVDLPPLEYDEVSLKEALDNAFTKISNKSREYGSVSSVPALAFN